MDSDQGKLFIGGISWETTEENLKGYFGKYGEVVQTVIMRDKLTGKPRGFGFVVFADPSVLDRVLEDTHTIDGRTVEAKRALSREQQTTGRSENSNSGRGGAVNTRTKKIFVGGLPATLSEDEFRQYFQTFGNVVDVVVMYDQNTQRPRGFGFISFDEEEAVDRVLHKTFHDLQGKQVEVKRALPKDGNSGGGGARFGASGGSYQSFGGGSGNGTGSYDSSANRYGQQQTAGGGGGGYPSYGSAGYGSQPGYGAAAAGYGGYGYGGPASGYGNPNAQQGQQKSSWNSQAPTGYGPGSGYGAPGSGYGVPGSGYGAPGSGYGAPGSGYGAPGQPQNPGLGGYGNQGYGGYGGAPNSSVADQGAGYGDANANPGYGSGSWNPQGGYGGGYGGPQSRQ